MTAKRKAIMLWRMIKSGSKNFVRHAWLSVAATAVMVVALSIILLAIVLNSTAKAAISEVSKNLKVSVYLAADVSDTARAELTKEFQDNQYVDSVEYVDVTEAQRRFSDLYGNNQKIIQGLTLGGSGTLPSSLEVSINDLEQIKNVGSIAEAEKYDAIVDSVSLGRQDARNTIERAANAQRIIVTASILSALVFTIISILIIFNTIRMAIFSRSEEISIMKLIGATPNYIRAPFLVEASMYGVVAGIIATSGVYTLIVSVGSKVANQDMFKPALDFYQQPQIAALMLLGAITTGILVAVLSSILAMNRYLRFRNW